MNIVDVSRYTMTILFSQNNKGIDNLKLAMLDICASLICDMSLINKTLEDAIEVNANLICDEYIDFLIDTIEKTNGVTFNYNKVKPVVDFLNYTRQLSVDMDDEGMSGELEYAQSKLSGVIGHDMAKATSMLPIVSSKSNEFISSIKSKLSELVDQSVLLQSQISECEIVIEACDFAKYYLLNKCGQNREYQSPPILEEKYDRIISELCAEYVKWKG